MMVQHLKRRPLSRYLKDFKHSQTHCAHCRKLLDRITLVRDGKIVNKIEISRLDTLLDENGWQTEQKSWAALCRFCGDLGSDSNLLIVFYVQIMPDDLVMQLHRF